MTEPDDRRLTARSVVASTLLGVEPPELPTRSLVATAELLGVTAGSARVAMSRMVAAGELTATDDGYRLAGGPLLTRQARQALSRRGPDDDWDGSWDMTVAAEGLDAPTRAELRQGARALRYGTLRDGVWLRPANLPNGTLAGAEALLRAHGTGLTTTPDRLAEVAGRLWDLRAWSIRADQLLDELARRQAELHDSGPAGLAEGFISSAAILRHLQADPLLPAALLPDPWPGPALRAAHRHFDRLFKSTLRTWQQALAHR